MTELLLVGRNYMSGICKLKPKKKLFKNFFKTKNLFFRKQEAQLMLTTGSTRLAVSRGQQTWYHSTCYVQFPIVQ